MKLRRNKEKGKRALEEPSHRAKGRVFFTKMVNMSMVSIKCCKLVRVEAEHNGWGDKQETRK